MGIQTFIRDNCRVAPAPLCAAAVATLSCAAHAQAPPARAILHDAARGDTAGALTTSFSRAVPTLDPLGAPVGPNEPRYDQKELFVGAPRSTQITTGDWSLARMMAAGSALDGTPLWFYARRGGEYVADIYATEPTGGIANPPPEVVYHRWALEDVWGGQVPGARAPLDAAGIYHGAVVVASNLNVDPDPDDPDKWQAGHGLAIFVGNHDGSDMLPIGQTPGDGLRLVYADSVLGIDPDARRVRTWSVTGPFVPQRDGSPGTEVWFCVGDYRYAADNPTGGVWILIRATRPTENDPWTFDPPCEVTRIEQDANPDTPITHAHPAGVAWDRDSGHMTFVALAGDGDTKNAMIATTLFDPTRYANAVSTYTPGWWPGDPLQVAFARDPHPAWLDVLDDPPSASTVWGPTNYNYHGGASAPGAQVSTKVPAFQALGIAPGPTPNTLILGADNMDSPGFARLDVEESPAHLGAVLNVDQLRLGSSAYQALTGPGFLCYEIRNTTPELGGPYVAAVTTDNFSSPGGRRLLWGEPEGEGIYWGVVDSGSFNPAYYVNGAIYRGWNIVDYRIGGLIRIEPGGTTLARPQRLGQGGSNMTTLTANASPEVVAGAGADATLLSQAELDALPPRPFSGPVVRLTMDELSQDPTLLLRATLRSPAARFETGEVATRVWLLAAEPDPPRANKVRLAFAYRNSFPSDYIWFYPVRASSTTRWTPVDLFGLLPVSPNLEQPVVHAQASYEWFGVEDRSCDLYLGFDAVVKSTQPPGYPLPPDTAVLPQGLPAPSEARTLTGFGGAPEGTLIVAGMIPHDGIDYGWFERADNDVKSLPILSIIEPGAGLARIDTRPYHRYTNNAPSWLTIDLVGGDHLYLRAGPPTPPLFMDELEDVTPARGDTFQLAIRWRPGRLDVDGVWAGKRFDKVTIINHPPIFTPEAELRFGGLQRDHDALELPPISAFGVGHWTEYLDDTALEDALHTASYLDPPPPDPGAIAPPIDLLDWRDVAEFLGHFAAGDARADLAAPFGQIDAADLNALIDALNAIRR